MVEVGEVVYDKVHLQQDFIEKEVVWRPCEGGTPPKIHLHELNLTLMEL